MTVGLGIFSYLTFETTSKYFSNKIVLRLSEAEVSISEIPFPAVTMCPQVFDEHLSKLFQRGNYTPTDEKFEEFSDKLNEFLIVNFLVRDLCSSLTSSKTCKPISTR